MIQEIEALLAKKIGLEPSVIGSQKIAKAVETRRLYCGLTDSQSYLRKLQTTPQELEELIENIVVPETWFFRDRKPFELLVNYVISEWLPKNKNSTLRLLSAPCSTGEEPYSIAIALMNAGLLPHKFRIDAVDISKKALHKAAEGIYGKNSFRGGDLPQKERYFQQIGEGFQICATVRQSVNFMHGNLLEPVFLNGNKYDVIFCRNLLIYLSELASTQLMQALDCLLIPNGLIFVGAAETGKVPGDRFVSVRQPFTFAYRKTEQSGNNLTLPSVAPKQNLSFLTKPTFTTKVVQRDGKLEQPQLDSLKQAFSRTQRVGETREGLLSPANSKTNPLSTELIKSKSGSLQSPISPAPSPIPDLQTARKLADAGKLEEAAKAGKTFLGKNPTSAEGYLLLGEVYQATGDDRQAEQHFQKALYLQPDCYEALTHLALLKQNRGDFSGAALIKQRIKRLENSQNLG
ncbi:CheR family methyltransferase [Aerosakkonema sp. BLCC-F183]|uniref:CheR family methyltransferase n=1 Tax=Aerosakkonema sp. BLCC-F183 TaxID=3342834 RepID=UPI0035B95B64